MILLKKFLTILSTFLFLFSSAFAGVTTGYKYGKGPLKLTQNTANILEFYFSGGKQGVYAEKQVEAWKPGLIAVSSDGSNFSFFRHPLRINRIDSKHYAGIAISQCKKKSGQECFLFANAYKIVWDNGSDKKKRKLKFRDIRAGKTLALLSELGFYDGGSTKIKKSETQKIKKKVEKSTNDNGDIVKKLKDLKDLFDNGALTEEEYKKAKKKILN